MIAKPEVAGTNAGSASTPGNRYSAAAGVLLAALVTGVGIWNSHGSRAQARWFGPGPLGYEGGRRADEPRAPAFRTRYLYAVESVDKGEWARHNGLTPPLSFSHNLANIFPRELFDERPQFFPLVNGTRWRPPAGHAAWNPDLGRADVAAFAADAARWQFTVDPASETFSVGVNDGLLFGESAETRTVLGPPRWFRGRPDYSPLIFTFANRVAEDLAATNPDKFVGTLAYYWGENAPPFKVHPQVLPFLTADRTQGYDEAFRREELELQNRWGAAGPRRLGLYDYLYGGGFLVPRVVTRLLAENLRHARRAGFTDYFAEVHANWGLDGPMPWLTAQLLQDPEQSPEALLDEYYSRYFREAAEPMRQFYRICERQWMNQAGSPYWLKHYRNESQAELYPPAVCRELRGCLDEAEGRAADATTRARVRLVSDAFGASERLVAMQGARVDLARAALQRAGWRELVGAMRRFVDVRLTFLAYMEWLRHEQPLAIAPFTMDDYLVDDPTSGAMRVALADAAAHSEAEAARAACERIDPTLADMVGSAHASRAKAASTGKPEGGVYSPERRIAGLLYGLSMPAGWVSRNEPNETLRATWGRGPEPVLRLEGAKFTQIFRWAATRQGEVHVGRIRLRGLVGPSSIVSLRLTFVRANQTELPAVTVFRLPEGSWPEWRELEVVAKAPREAAWVVVELRVRDQSDGAWIEARDFEIESGRQAGVEKTP